MPYFGTIASLYAISVHAHNVNFKNPYQRNTNYIDSILSLLGGNYSIKLYIIISTKNKNRLIIQIKRFCGEDGTRTHGLLHAMQAL